jgi:hypothetical protein
LPLNYLIIKINSKIWKEDIPTTANTVLSQH